MSTMHDEAKTIICKNCGYKNNKQSKFCPNCGVKVVREDICANCGTKIDPSLKFCHECGSKTPKFIALEKAEAERIAQAEAERIAREKAEFIDFGLSHKICELKRIVAEEVQKARKEAERITFEKAKSVLEKWNMVLIPDSAKHKGLYFGKYQVTQAQWQAIMGNNPSNHKGDSSRPVECVSWNDCQEFIEILNALDEVKQAGLTFFLPTSEQWEYACRAGSKGKYGLLADGREGSLDEMGWYKANSRGETHPIGKKKPNAWGLYDMHGNVWEWTASEYYSYGSPILILQRICRGGSCRDRAGCCGAGDWYYDRPGYRHVNLGFRLAASRTGK